MGIEFVRVSVCSFGIAEIAGQNLTALGRKLVPYVDLHIAYMALKRQCLHQGHHQSHTNRCAVHRGQNSGAASLDRQAPPAVHCFRWGVTNYRQGKAPRPKTASCRSSTIRTAYTSRQAGHTFYQTSNPKLCQPFLLFVEHCLDPSLPSWAVDLGGDHEGFAIWRETPHTSTFSRGVFHQHPHGAS